MTVLISEHSQLYQHDEPQTETKISPQLNQSSIQRGKVEWLTEEDAGHTTSSGTVSKSQKERPQSSQSTTFEKDENSSIEEKGKSRPEEKLDGKADGKTEEKSRSDGAGSPSKQSKALPSWRCSFKGSAASGGTRGKMGGSAGDVSAAGGSNWLINGLSSLRAHRRTTSSGERLKDTTLSLKDSTLSLKETALSLKDSPRVSDEDSSQTPLSYRTLHQSHRMSAYDNVAPSSLSLPTDTSVWTSFNIPLTESEGNDKVVKIGRGQEESTDMRESANTEDRSASGTEDDSAPTNETNMLTQLKQELKKHRLSYEARIRK